MSTTPTKQIDGDVAIGRHVAIGGNATVRASATIGHNLRVEGWLEAKNIKWANKGLFATEAQLREAYPSPEKGWWALVTAGLTEAQLGGNLGQVYMVIGGKWVAQTNADGSKRLGGNPTVDSTAFREELAALADDVEAIKADEVVHAGTIAALGATVHSQTQAIEELSGRTTGLGAQIGGIQAALDEQAKEIASAAEPSIGLGDLETLGTDGTLAGMRALSKAIVHTRYRVAYGDWAVGCLDVFSDSAGHEITEVLTSNCTISEDGTVTSGHVDGAVTVLKRHYNINSPWLENERGTWTAWESADAALAEDIRQAKAVADRAGILPFAGVVKDPIDLMLKSRGVYYVEAERLFVKVDGDRLSYPEEYANGLHTLDGKPGGPAKRLFRLDDRLYRYGNGRLEEIGQGGADEEIAALSEAVAQAAAAAQEAKEAAEQAKDIAEQAAVGEWHPDIASDDDVLAMVDEIFGQIGKDTTTTPK